MKRLLSTPGLALGLSIAAIASSVATYIAISRSANPYGPDPYTVFGLLILNLLLFLALLGVLVRKARELLGDLRRGLAGSKLQTRIMLVFSLVTIIPTLVVAVSSAMFFNVGIQSWFDKRVSTGLEESVVVAEAYLNEHKEVIRADAIAMSRDLDHELQFSLYNAADFNRAVSAQATLRSLTEAIVISRGRVIARTMLSFSLMFERLPQELLERADAGEVVIMTPDNEKVQALVKLGSLPETYLLIGRLVDSKVLKHMDSTQGAVNEYRRLKAQIGSLQVQFFFVFVLGALVLLLVVMLYGMYFARWLVVPISQLVGAAERVRAGDFSVKVEEGKENNELGTLARAFNRMTGQLSAQRGELVDANRQIDERRRFIEAVLGGVTAGVIALSRDRYITLCNRSAQNLLGGDMQMKPIDEVLPGLDALLDAAATKSDKTAQGDLRITRDSKTYTLHIRAAAEMLNGEIESFIVTMDDITELVSAQRNAAWSDVARRVAHEIKNPLTPIQLSAERLRRKYAKYIGEEEAENFIRYTETITRHVGDIGRMVEEFVAFARMPAAVFENKDLISIIKSNIFSEQVAHPELIYQLDIPKESVYLSCDERQINRLFTNLLKNAAESVSSRSQPEQGELAKGCIEVRISSGPAQCVVEMLDNGIGFPPDDIHRMMEPYVTTRSKGTGLGLAIAKKIMEEHKGSIYIENRPEGGACVRLVFNLQPQLEKSE